MDFCHTYPTSRTPLDVVRQCVVTSSNGTFHPGGHCLTH
jgi:hypothetical protein